MRNVIVIVIVIVVLFFALLRWNSMRMRSPESSSPADIRFVPVGDSYTIGEGVGATESWPVLLVNHLEARKVSIELVDNPSRTGWTTEDTIERELPTFVSAKPNFATLFIGVNDWVQGVDAKTFRSRLGILMDRMLATVGGAPHMLAITIPDFSVTPTGKQFGDPAKNSKGIQEFNQIIKEESAKRGIAVVDIFTLSQEMGNNPSLVAPDGLHPSAQEYKHWEGIIFEEAIKLLPHPEPN